MKRFAGLIALASCAALLAGCGGGAGRALDKRIDRALVNAPGKASPSKVVATELAYARFAKENGQWEAYRAYSAPGAVIHGSSGPLDLSALLSTADETQPPTNWNPRAVWMSCDSLTAVSQGRFTDADGKVGTYVTVWQRQSDGDYKWTYDAAGFDDPQPPARNPDADDENVLVVSNNAIQGLIADCPKKREPTPPPPPMLVDAEYEFGFKTSRDRTLQWRWEHAPDGTRRFVVEFFHEETWQVAIDQSFAPGTETAPKTAPE